MKNFVPRIKSYLSRELRSIFFKLYKPKFKENLLLHKKYGYKNYNDFIQYAINSKNFKDYSVLKDVKNYFLKQFSEESKKIVALADDFLVNGIRLHGFNYSFKDKVLWHTDPMTKKEIKIKYWRNYRFNTNSEFPENSIDPILLFKLHTHQHMIRYVQAYSITSNKKYLYKCLNELEEWIDIFPTGFGYPHLIPLNISQRLITWCFIFLILKDDEYFQKKLMNKFIQSMDDQAKFMSENLSIFGQTNNFLISELVSLKFINHIFPFIDYKYDLDKVLIEELDKQICEDGTSFENSTGYQRFVTELLVILSFLSKNDADRYDIYTQYLNGLIQSLANLSTSSGYMPHIGDVSLERAYWFETEMDVFNISDLISISSVLTKNNSLKNLSTSCCSSLFWMLGMKGVELFNQMKSELTECKLNIYPYGGLGSMRSSNLNSDISHISFDCGEIGLNNQGGHGHNDFGSFSFSFNNQPIIIDRGTCTYFTSSKKRNEYRSSLSHNMPIINNSETSKLGKNLFTLENIISAKINKRIEEKLYSFIDLSHKGYARIDNKFDCSRKLALTNNNFFLIEDKIKGKEKKSLKWNFYLHPSIMPVKKSDSLVVLQKDNKNLFEVEIINNTSLKWNIKNTTCSLSYGSELVTKKLSIKYDSIGTEIVLFIFKPCIDLSKKGYNTELNSMVLKNFDTKFIS